MTMILHGFTAADGWTISGDVPNATSGFIRFEPGFNDTGEACLHVFTDSTDNGNKPHDYTIYTYNDMQNSMWNGTEVERGQILCDLVMNAAKNLVGDCKVDVLLTDYYNTEWGGIVPMSLEYECSAVVHDCSARYTDLTVRLPTRSVKIGIRQDHMMSIIDNIKWSTDFNGVEFFCYDAIHGVIPTHVLKRYKELRNTQYIFGFGMHSDLSDEWVETIAEISRDIEEIKKMFHDMPMCNSLKVILEFPDGTRQTQELHSNSPWMVDILVQAKKPHPTGERSQLCDLPVELLQKIYFA
jgi:hypothetical protein